MPGSDDGGKFVLNLRNLAKKNNVLGKIVFLPFLNNFTFKTKLGRIVTVIFSFWVYK